MRSEHDATRSEGAMTAVLKDYNTVKEVAEILRASDETVYRLIKAGRLGHLRLMGGVRISREHVLSFLSANSHEASKGDDNGKT